MEFKLIKKVTNENGEEMNKKIKENKNVIDKNGSEKNKKNKKNKKIKKDKKVVDKKPEVSPIKGLIGNQHGNAIIIDAEERNGAIHITLNDGTTTYLDPK